MIHTVQPKKHNPYSPGGTILILTARDADSITLVRILERNGIRGEGCGTIEEFCGHIGDEADAAIVSDEMLNPAARELLKAKLSGQAPWSNLPLIILGSQHRIPLLTWNLLGDIDYAGQTQLLQRPLHTAELISAVRSALTSRKRQYQVRDELVRRYQIEEQLKKEAQRKNEFLAILGHELRNPLAVLTAAVELIQKQPSKDRLKWCEETVGTQVTHLQRLVNDLIDISRITRGKITLQLETLELKEQMKQAVEWIKTATSAKNLTVWFTEPPDGLLVRADPVRLQQIFGNLLKNAALYTPEGGDIWFSAKSEGPIVAVSCRDNGSGIERDQIDSLFIPFTSVNTQNEHNKNGLGIGLSIVKQLTELHGGTVDVYSEGAGRGSEFMVRLPQSPRRRQEKPGITGEKHRERMRMHTVLIAEDNRDFARLLGESLRDEGHQISLTETGAEAAEKAEVELPEYMIIDIGLPDMDGYTLAEQVRKIPGMEKSILIAVSGYPPDHAKSDKLFDHYIVKGSGIEKLFMILTG